MLILDSVGAGWSVVIKYERAIYVVSSFVLVLMKDELNERLSGGSKLL